MSSLFNADSNEALSGSSTSVFSISKESSGRPKAFIWHSKSHGGGSAYLSGLLSNYDAYQRWVRAFHERVQFVKGALAMLDMLADDSDAKKHRDLRRTEIERSEETVLKIGETVLTSLPLPFKFNRLIGSKNFSCFSKRSEVKSTFW
jgi:hypothetical protein